VQPPSGRGSIPGKAWRRSEQLLLSTDEAQEEGVADAGAEVDLAERGGAQGLVGGDDLGVGGGEALGPGLARAFGVEAVPVAADRLLLGAEAGLLLGLDLAAVAGLAAVALGPPLPLGAGGGRLVTAGRRVILLDRLDQEPGRLGDASGAVLGHPVEHLDLGPDRLG